jgi:hypothetical protein
VFDATGAEVGLFVERVRTDSWTKDAIVAYRATVPAIVTLNHKRGSLANRHATQLLFSEAGCEGQAYLFNPYPAEGSFTAAELFIVLIDGIQRLFLGANESAIEEIVASESWATAGDLYEAGCLDLDAPQLFSDLVRANEITLDHLGLTFPLPAPLYIAPSPEP